MKQQIEDIPANEKGGIATLLRKLKEAPFPVGSLESLTTEPKLSRLKAGRWRALYMVFKHARLIFVGDVVQKDDDTYSAARLARVLRDAKRALKEHEAKRNPAALDERVRAVLLDHPEWGNSRVATAVGCSANAVQVRRKAWGARSGVKLPWLRP